MEETMSESFTIANFRSVAHGLQEGQFAVGERKKASGLRDLDPKYKRLLDEPVTMTLGFDRSGRPDRSHADVVRLRGRQDSGKHRVASAQVRMDPQESAPDDTTGQS